MSAVPAPLHTVNFIMGNDIAGGKVYPDPEAVGSLNLDVKPELAQRHPKVVPVSILMRAQAQKQGHHVDLVARSSGPCTVRKPITWSTGLFVTRGAYVMLIGLRVFFPV